MTGFSNIGQASGFAGIGADGQPEGDLTGSYPNPLVVGIWDTPIDPRMPTNGDTLIYNGGEWIPTPTPTSTTFFQGVWNADTNTPDIENFPGLSDGYTWIVSVAGNTDVGGITGWIVGDYAVYSNGNWYKLSNSSFGWGLTGNNGTNPTINYVGTADAHDFVIRANASEVIRAYLSGGARISGSLLISNDLQVTNNVTGSNAKLLGDLEVCGGDITAKSAVFNLLNGVTTRINMGNSAAHNWLSGSTKFPQGISGSLTRLTDGTSAFVADVGILITSSSNGSIAFKVDDSRFAALSGSNFTGIVNFNAGLSGSLTKLTDGTSYIIAGNNATVVSSSNGAITVSAVPDGADTQVQFNDGGFFGGDSKLTFNKTTPSLTLSGSLLVSGSEAIVNNLEVTGSFNLGQQVFFEGTLTPPAITTTQNNYNPSNLEKTLLLRLQSTSPVEITGLAGGDKGRVLFLTNIGSFSISLVNESAGSSAAHRFLLPASSIVLGPNDSVILQYDSVSARWRSPNISRQAFAGVSRKRFFTTVANASTPIGGFATVSVGANSNFNTNFVGPDDYIGGLSAELIFIPSMTATGISLTVSSSYASIGSSYNTYATSSNYTINTVANQISSLDIINVVPQLQANSFCGLNIKHNLIGQTMYYIGVLLSYV